MNAPNIPGFEIIKKIGQGGMATVWMARQLSLDRTVAIKVLLPRFALAPEEVDRFRSEAQAAARLKHPGVVQVYDASVIDGSYYFVMEHIAGYTVGEWVRSKGALSERDALLVAEHVCDALGYAWEHAHIIHCDIKPDNIMLDDDGTVKVMDLGLARTLTAMSTDRIDEANVLGTPSYMSPEQARGDAHIDFRSDIYSLGATLYHLVTGQRMFADCDDYVALDQQLNGTVPDPTDVYGLSKPLSRLLEKMLAKDPARRGDSWSTVQADMRRVQSGVMPHGVLHAEDMSTIRRSERVSAIDQQRRERLKADPDASPSRILRIALWTTLIAVVSAVSLRLYLKISAEAPIQTATPALTATPPGSRRPAQLPLERPAPVINTDTQGQRSARIAELQTELKALENAGAYDDAERRIAAFGGSTPEDEAFRQRALQEVRWHREAVESKKRLENRKQQEQRGLEIMAPVLKAAASDVLSKNLSGALAAVQTLRANGELELFHSALEELETVLQTVNNLDAVILASFWEQQGLTIEVFLNSGPITLTVGEIDENGVHGTPPLEDGVNINRREILVRMQDLAPRERFSRMANGDGHAVALARGLMAIEAGAWRKAAEFFAGTHYLIADHLSEAARQKDQ